MANDAQMQDMLPCPFCGSGPTVSTQNASFSGVEALYWHGLHFVNCGTCGAEGAKEEDRSAAITAWNRRADLCASGQQVRALIKAGRAMADAAEHGFVASTLVVDLDNAEATLTPAPQPAGEAELVSQSALEAYGREKVREGMQKAANIARRSYERNKRCPDGCNCGDGFHIEQRILAEMEALE